MNNYKITVIYDGSTYDGWQKQDNTDNTIQSVLECRLGSYLNEEIELTASGRTDAGVNALCQAANFKCRSLLPLNKEFIKEINALLPESVKIKAVSLMNGKFHSRFDAVSKTYMYCIDTNERPSVFERRYVLHYPSRLDTELMRSAASILTGENDYRAFSSEKNPQKDTVRTIYKIEIIENKGKIKILYTGNGFLYNMVRILTGTLIEIGENKREICTIETAFKSKNRAAAGFTAPPCGLFLAEVNY